MQWQQDEYWVSSDKTLLDFEVIYQFISTSYWAKGIPADTLKTAIAGSLCFGLYCPSNDEQEQRQQVGFARFVTDGATFAYLADVFIIEAYRGKGLSKWLMECMLTHPSLQGLRRMMLATLDAHDLYKQYGFSAVDNPQILMQKHQPDIYQRPKS